MEIGANSTLLVAKVNTTDAGNYTCSIGESQQYTVLVHVLNGKIQLTCLLTFLCSSRKFNFILCNIHKVDYFCNDVSDVRGISL